MNSYSVLLIGSGRLARHLRFYLESEFSRELSDRASSTDPSAPQGPGPENALSQSRLLTWSRRENTVVDLEEKLASAHLVALALSDSALEPFSQSYFDRCPHVPWIHFSGALEVPHLQSFHPLMTFGQELYTLEFYRQIPFVHAVSSKMPQTLKWPQGLSLPNPLYALPCDQKPLYHALCVLSGNFSTLLWQKAQAEFSKLGLPPSLLQAYAEQGLRNVFAHPASALTGPLARRDFKTQEKNLQALAGDPFAEVYRAFQSAYAREALFQLPQPLQDKGQTS